MRPLYRMGIYGRGGTSDHVLDLLNLLEEFSLRVKLLGAEKDESLSLVRYSFCEMLEQVSVRLVAQRDMISGNDMYRNCIDLYTFWIEKVDAASEEERIAAFQRKFNVTL